MAGRSLRGRALWTLIDQGLVSAANFTLLLVVVRFADVAGVGVFGIVYSTYFLLAMLARGLTGDPLLVRYTGPEEVAQHAGRAAGATFLLTSLVGLLLQLCWLGDGGLWWGLAALGLSLVPLAVADVLRSAFFAAGTPTRAAAADAVMLLTQVAAMVLLGLYVSTEPWALVLGWGLSGVAGVVVAALLGGRLPQARAARGWLAENKDIGVPFTLDYGVNRGAEQGLNVLVSALASLGALGALTTSRMAFAPLTTVQTGVNAFVIPHIAALRRASALVRARRLAVLSAVGLAGLMLAWGLALLLIPERWGTATIGNNWSDARDLLLPMTVFSCLNAGSFALWAALKALEGAREALRARAIGGVALMALPALGTVWGGAAGAVWGMAAAALVGVMAFVGPVWTRTGATADLAEGT